MANPRTATECIRASTFSDPTLRELKSTPSWWAYSIGGSGTVNVYFFDESGEIEGSAQLGLVIATEVGIMGIPGIVFPIEDQPAQGVAERNLPRAIWMEIIAASTGITWGLYGLPSDLNNDGKFLKSGSHRSYTLANTFSVRLGPAPSPHLGQNGALDVDGGGGGGSTVSIIGTAGTDKSGTITTGGTAQVAAASNTSRSEFTGFNPLSATESLSWSDTGTATTSSYETIPGGTFTTNTTNAISVLGATTGHAYAATER